MVDHIRTLLLNPGDRTDYRPVSDAVTDKVLVLFADGAVDAFFVDKVLPLALAPDLVPFRTAFDQRLTPPAMTSVYRDEDTGIDLSGVYARVLGDEGWWTTSRVFNHPDPAVASVLRGLRDAALSKDSAYALGAVLLACAYRRLILQGKEG